MRKTEESWDFEREGAERNRGFFLGAGEEASCRKGCRGVGREVFRSTFNAAIFVKQGKHVTCIYRREVSRMTSSPLAYTCAIWCMHRFTLLAQLSASMLLLHRSVNFFWNSFLFYF